MSEQKFPEIQAYQKAFLMRHWKEVRRSVAMKQVFEAIGQRGSASRFPGFVEVWSAILPCLDFNAAELREDGSSELMP
jgi:hypothetical protein